MISIKQTLQQAWETWKANKGIATGIYLLYLVILFLPDLLAYYGPPTSDGFSFLFHLLKFAITSFATLGWLWVNIKLARSDVVTWTDFFAPVNALLRFIGGELFYSLIILLGVLLIMVPVLLIEGLLVRPDTSSLTHWGALFVILAAIYLIIYLGLTFAFWGYFIVDKHTAILQAFRLSAQITKGHRFKLFLLLLLSIGLNLLGFLALGIGLLVTFPVTALMWAHAYKTLSLPINNSRETL